MAWSQLLARATQVKTQRLQNTVTVVWFHRREAIMQVGFFLFFLQTTMMVPHTTQLQW